MILLADDDRNVQQWLGRVLRMAGYELMMAENGCKALQLAQAHLGGIDLLLSDVPTVNVSSVAPGLAWSTLNGSGGSNRVPFLSVNPVDIDRQFRMDARIQRELPGPISASRHSMRSTLNTTPPLTNRPFRPQGLFLKPTANLGTGTQAQGFPDGTNARRMQVGLRLTI